MKTGLVLEGGAMRGIYTAGVLDVFLEQGISPGMVMGVSAGAIHGISFLSRQGGQSIRYYMKYCRDKRFMSFYSLVTTGDVVGEQFCYHDIPDTLDPFDHDAFEASGIPFWAVCSNLETGQGEYIRCPTLRGEAMEYLRASASMPFYASIPLTLALTVALGFAVERIAYKPLRTAPRMSVMISAIGVSYLLQNVALYVTGGLSKEYPAIPWLSDSVVVLGATTKRVTVITPILTIVLIVLLVLLINHTKVGMGMRAVSKDFETSLLMGIKIDSVISVTFIIGSFLAAVGSLLFFSNYTGVTPTVGAIPGIKAFIAAVFGGIGSVPGAVIGAFIIGICENIIKALHLTTFSDAFTFALLILILIFKPTGLFGEKTTDKV